MTVKELAKICDVSPATISRAIRGQAPVNADTRKKINDAIAAYNYTPRTQKPEKKRRKNGMIGVVLPSVEHPFARSLILEIQKQVKTYDRPVLILPEQEDTLLNGIHRLPLDGAILLSAEIAPHLITRLKQLDIQLIMCSALPLVKNLSSVRVDDLSAAYEGVRYLLELGHRNIGFITDSPKSVGSGFQRIAGCRKAMEDHGIHVTGRMFFSGACDYDSGFRGSLELLDANPDLTAIFAHSDISALGAMAALTDRGLKIPGDISVLGFDGIRSGEQARPRLTCVQQPLSEIVSKTLELLDAMIENPGKDLFMSITLKTTVIVRDTCGKPRTHCPVRDGSGSFRNTRKFLR